MALKQNEADQLLGMQKRFESDTTLLLDRKSTRTLISQVENSKERFLLDINRGSLNLKKYTFQTRSRTVIVLVRFDIEGSPHGNPGITKQSLTEKLSSYPAILSKCLRYINQKIPCPHLHLYVEGFDDRWAFPLNEFPSLALPQDIVSSFRNFAQFCNIVDLPVIQQGLGNDNE